MSDITGEGRLRAIEITYKKQPYGDYSYSKDLTENDMWYLLGVVRAQQALIDQQTQEIDRFVRLAWVRPELQWFVKQMESKLQENDHKQHWSKLHQDYLIHRLYQEAGELWNAIRNEPPENIVKEAADVGNFAMMIADNAERMTPS